ncbi:probable LRR receptor-like serine/threonine-protein kinase At1g07650 [Macadamia integrifolia]|uniref:probable LRR receptor-like serine/threonine-protein kinase At1g07650 n=1 Tax=Macadamia integrifolia TaxID=60698 RepID=UPI001C4ED6CF|nr:probable LRR receptor-like serine/threonine-protein kinase At1g07650 [Macadamia integrifolia]XP_042482783.1 probable LRR receptor-like serine/threonine-protein kinase At1g07650 [Macadamia integrifolia]XP_042482785.1 probable LRR receptor-like serine/threonine-protein kinase At1g07650 [Macadamia integrifolia]
MFIRPLLLVSVLVFCCFGTFRCAVARLPQEEVDALKQIAKTMGKHGWNFSVDPCSGEYNWVTPYPAVGYDNNVTCDCHFQNETVCHVVSIFLRAQSLEGILPPELVRLHYLQEIDLTNNKLSGIMPLQWASMKLQYISLTGNQLSGEIPKELGNLISLKYLSLESNKFNGTLPPELGTLVNLETLSLSSNRFTGMLPVTLGKLTNLKDFEISDNNFHGPIPDFIKNWTQMNRLVIQGSGLEGPIPSQISLLERLTDLRISDINGAESVFPTLMKMQSMQKLILRNCNISGVIPSYIWEMKNLKTFDVSFNKLVGGIPEINGGGVLNLKFIYLTGNMLTGPIPDWILKKDGTLNTRTSVDLSYNNITWASPDQPTCNGNVNLFRSSSTNNSLKGLNPCMSDSKCSQYWYSLHINSGGRDVTIGKTIYEADDDAGGAARSVAVGDRWGFSSTGDFMDNNADLDSYIATNVSVLSMKNSELYTTARLSPLSLTYYGLCLGNGNYTVRLHFADIVFTDTKKDEQISSLGRRLFDIYIQGKLVWKDFNIKEEAGGDNKEIIKQTTVFVQNNTLEIRFYWAGKGTTSIPTRGFYGPLISAISVDPNFKPPSVGGKKRTMSVLIATSSLVCLIFLILGLLWWKGCLGGKSSKEKDLKGADLITGSFTLRQIKTATNNFDPTNKIGEGGFGSVYKGLLSDGTVIAVKQLSSKSRQGNREFVNEIGMISGLQHPNLVRLYGCCIEGNQLLLVYEYMENNCLARALFGEENLQLKLDWPTRRNICVGIAKGLVFLHEESRLKIVHRDIKATNVLLDEDLSPKISDFGLARLYEEENSHVSTRIAGTIGYMAPEYAQWGRLSYKADVYSFGVVALEIVSGKNNSNFRPENDCMCLVDWAIDLQQKGSLMEMVDPKLGSEFNVKEAERMIKVGLWCTNVSPTLRPTMSTVVSMLEGQRVVQDTISDPSITMLRSKSKTDDFQHVQRGTQYVNSSPERIWIGSTSTSSHDQCPSSLDSQNSKNSGNASLLTSK